MAEVKRRVAYYYRGELQRLQASPISPQCRCKRSSRGVAKGVAGRCKRARYSGHPPSDWPALQRSNPGTAAPLLASSHCA